MRRSCIPPLIALAVCFLAACDDEDQPATEANEQQAFQSAQPAEKAPPTVCSDAACRDYCANVDDPDIVDDCPDAYEAGCFDGTAPEDYPCKLFLMAQEQPQPAPAEPSGGEAEQPKADKELVEPPVEKGGAGIQIDNLNLPEPKKRSRRRPARRSGSYGSGAGPAKQDKSDGVISPFGEAEEARTEEIIDAKATPVGD